MNVGEQRDPESAPPDAHADALTPPQPATGSPDPRRAGNAAIALACVPLVAWPLAWSVPGLPTALVGALGVLGLVAWPVALAVAIGSIVLAPRGRGWIALAIVAAIAGGVYLLLATGDFGR